MNSSKLASIALAVLLIAAVVSAAAFRSQVSQIKTQGDATELTIVVHEPPQINGLPPLNINCGKAHLLGGNQLEFSCTFKNNTAKAITAASFTYTVEIAKDGQVINDPTYSTIIPLLHPRLKGVNKLIGPGAQGSVGPPGPISYPDAVIKGVKIELDYLEFEDGDSIGVDQAGSNIIKEYREGAGKCLAWLSQEYNRKGKSVEAVIPLLQQDLLLTGEFSLHNRQQKQGARLCQYYLRKANEKHGATKVKELLSQ